MAARSPLHEVLLVNGMVMAATFVVTRLRGVPPFADFVHLAVGGLFLFTAIHMAQREEAGVERFGIAVGGLLQPPREDSGPVGPLGLWDLGRTVMRGLPAALKEIGVALALAAVIFPPFALGFALWHGPSHPFALQLPEDFGSFAAAQFLVVGLPEEAFYRGYVQTRLADHFGSARRHWLGVTLHPAAWVGQAVLFALIHFVVDLNPARLAVFFPGLLFGWLRAWRGGIGAPIALHALSNMYSEVLVTGWLR